jgi:hypothetical protein
VGILDRLRGVVAPRWDGTTGRPPSGNGASSFHLQWIVPDGAWTVAEATVEVEQPPSVPKLYFWAMQVSFDERGRHGGAGHIGLQWHRDHPNGTAVNWGGYAASGGELSGSRSALPSATGNVNTRDYDWRPRRPYRLRVSPSPEPAPRGMTGWRGEVIDLEAGVVTHIRDLWAPGSTLTDPIVWSEVFADCDDPAVIVQWSDLRLTDTSNRTVTVDAVTVNYQARSAGGCATTDSRVARDRAAFEQRTSVERNTAQGSTLRVRES